MLGYVILFATSLCGYAGTALWSALLAATVLFSVSLVQHHTAIRHSLARGYQDDVEQTLWLGGFTAFALASTMFLLGNMVRVIGH